MLPRKLPDKIENGSSNNKVHIQKQTNRIDKILFVCFCICLFIISIDTISKGTAIKEYIINPKIMGINTESKSLDLIK